MNDKTQFKWEIQATQNGKTSHLSKNNPQGQKEKALFENMGQARKKITELEKSHPNMQFTAKPSFRAKETHEDN